MKQGSGQWLEWRRKGIGASDQTHIHWSAPWSRGAAYIYDLKRGLIAEEEGNEHMLRGIELEKNARLEYELLTGLSFEPQLVQSLEFPHIIASLDCWNDERKRGAEIKCPNKDDHALALDGKIPQKYIPQLCHQVFAAGTTDWDYVSYDGHSIAVVPFVPDPELVIQIVQAATKLWGYVGKGERPMEEFPHPLFDTRIPQIKDPQLIAEGVKNAEMRAEVAELEALIAESDERILKACDLPRAVVGGVMIVGVNRKNGFSRYIKPRG